MNPRIIGFDFGLKRIGVATGNSLTGTTQALSTVPAKRGQPDWQVVERLLEQWSPSTLIVGLPLNMDGSESTMSANAREFGEQLRRRFNLEVVFTDERLSTAHAEQLLNEATPPRKSLARKRLKVRDNLAAELIVQTYLNQLHNSV